MIHVCHLEYQSRISNLFSFFQSDFKQKRLDLKWHKGHLYNRCNEWSVAGFVFNTFAQSPAVCVIDPRCHIILSNGLNFTLVPMLIIWNPSIYYCSVFLLSCFCAKPYFEELERQVGISLKCYCIYLCSYQRFNI